MTEPSNLVKDALEPIIPIKHNKPCFIGCHANSFGNQLLVRNNVLTFFTLGTSVQNHCSKVTQVLIEEVRKPIKNIFKIKV